MDPILTSSLISAGGNILGGLLGKGKSPGQTVRAQMRAAISTGAKYGLHPLASIGAASGGYSTGNVLGDGLAAAADALAQGVAAKGEKAAADRAQIKAEEVADAQIAEARSRTLLNLQNAKRAAVTIDPYAPRRENALMRVMLENGETVLVPNPDVYEIGPGELTTGRVLLEGGRGIQRARDAAPVIKPIIPNAPTTRNPGNGSDRRY